VAVGQVEANLGGDVYKKRIARKGAGKRGGYRVIILFRYNERLFFVFGYPKSVLSNIKESAVRGFKNLAKDYFARTDAEIEILLRSGELLEITGGSE
jgi:hypothetical protein